MNAFKLFCLAGLVTAMAGAAMAVAPSFVTVSNAWFRMLPAGLPAGGYFTLRNKTDSELQLTGGRSEACGMLMLHKSEEESGMSRMSEVPTVDVRAHGAISFRPGGLHLMCTAPTSAMKLNTAVSVRLEFSNGTKVTVSFLVRNAQGE